MSKLKISNQLFLGKAELSRMWKFLVDDGFRRNLLSNTVRYGIVYNSVDSSQANHFDAFQVSQGTNPGTIKIKEGHAINRFGEVIYKAAEDNIVLPDDGAWYWIKIKHMLLNEEVGLVSVDAGGVMTGVGTKFTEVFRGQPNAPSKIRFNGTAGNPGHYEVLQVNSDTQAILNVTGLVPENNLRYVVLGTFTPGYVPLNGEMEIFGYDSCEELNLQKGIVKETTFGTRPVYLQNEDFFVARVRRTGATVQIEDKRTEIWQTKADFALKELLKVGNDKVIGVESVMYDTPKSSLNENLVRIAWGVKAQSWTINASARIVSLLGFEGGRMKTTADFQNGDFNYWKIYLPNGKFVRVLSSVKNGTQVDCSVDMLDPNDFSPNTEPLIVVPDAEEIEFLFEGREGMPNDTVFAPVNASSIKFNMPISNGFGIFRLPIYADTFQYDPGDPATLTKFFASKYMVWYRFRTFKDYTAWTGIPTATPYLDERAFNEYGKLVDATKTTAIGLDGSITLRHHPKNYHDLVGSIILGDALGVERRTLDNGSPVLPLRVGVERQYQYIEGDLAMTIDHIIDLSVIGAKNGNKFFINFGGNIYPGEFKFKVTQNYENPGNIGTVLFEVLDYHVNNFLKDSKRQLMLRCEFDGANWIVYPHLTVHPVNKQCDDQWWVVQTSGSVQHVPGASYGSSSVVPTESLTCEYKITKDGRIQLRGGLRFNTDMGGNMSATSRILLGTMPKVHPDNDTYLPTFQKVRYVPTGVFYDTNNVAFEDLRQGMLRFNPNGEIWLYLSDELNLGANYMNVFFDGITL